jgi:hypothetical protein
MPDVARVVMLSRAEFEFYCSADWRSLSWLVEQYHSASSMPWPVRERNKGDSEPSLESRLPPNAPSSDLVRCEPGHPKAGAQPHALPRMKAHRSETGSPR